MYLTGGRCPVNSNNSSNCCYCCDDDGGGGGSDGSGGNVGDVSDSGSDGGGGSGVRDKDNDSLMVMTALPRSAQVNQASAPTGPLSPENTWQSRHLKP